MKLFRPRTLLILLWGGLLTFWLSLVVYGYAVRGNWFNIVGELPDFQVLENPKLGLASTIYSADGYELGNYFETNRTFVDFEDISIHVIRALIATEDERYEKHAGIDQRATMRVIKGVLTGKSAGGGSTITQQLAKNLFRIRTEEKYQGSLHSTKLQMLAVKPKEWIIASRLEHSYTKKEIITMYLNTVRFGNYAVGINEAAKIYFNKKAKNLTLLEASTLVGTLKANSKFDPKRNPENSTNRRNVVLSQILKYSKKYTKNYLAQESFDSLTKEPLVLSFNQKSYNDGYATHFRAAIRKDAESICTKKGYNVLTDGLKIYTTLNYDLQRTAEHSLKGHLLILQDKFLKEWGNRQPWEKGYLKKELKKQWFYKQALKKYNDNADSAWQYIHTPREREIAFYDPEYKNPDKVVKYKKVEISDAEEYEYYKKFLHAGFVSVDPHTGQVKAWVGGIDRKYFEYDHVKQGRRQVGSTFKPILYSAAINLDYSPCKVMLDAPVSIRTEDDKLWIPNIKATNKMLTLKQGLGYSLNNFAAMLMREVKPKNVINYATKFGIPREQLDANLSLALGTCTLNMMELVRPYMTFVNHGMLAEPYTIQKIVDKYGTVIYEHKSRSKKIISEINAYKMVTMLREGTAHGTGRKLTTTYQLSESDIGGKTGTTQNSKDGWFVGITNRLVTIAWVGVEDNHVNFRYNRRWYGGSMALPIVGNYLRAVYKKRLGGIKPEPFETPRNFSISTAYINNHLSCRKGEKINEEDYSDIIDIPSIDDLEY